MNTQNKPSPIPKTTSNLKIISGLATGLGIVQDIPDLIQLTTKHDVSGIAPLGLVLGLIGTLLWMYYYYSTDGIYNVEMFGLVWSLFVTLYTTYYVLKYHSNKKRSE